MHNALKENAELALQALAQTLFLARVRKFCVSCVLDRMVEKPTTQWTTCYLSFGIICCVISLAVIAISFATDQWINCQVKNGFADSWSGSPLYNCTYCPEMFYTRNRGLFRTCYPGSGVQCRYLITHNSYVFCLCNYQAPTYKD